MLYTFQNLLQSIKYGRRIRAADRRIRGIGRGEAEPNHEKFLHVESRLKLVCE